MNNRTLYSLLIVFLMALTVNMAHVVVEHERDVCDVCLHIQANDEMDVAVDPDVSGVIQPHQTPLSLPALVHVSRSYSLKSIRAPPHFA